MGWFHAAYAAGELDGLDGPDGGTCEWKPKKVQPPPCPKSLTGIETIYHMCPKSEWEEAVQEKLAYFPSTFHKDGKFTRASVFKEGLVDVANHFYKESSPKDEAWICLEVNLKFLLDLGIVVLPQPPVEEQEQQDAAAAANKEEKKDEEPTQCFQVYSGFSTIIPGLIQNIYSIKRGGCGTFLALENPKPYLSKPKKEKQQKQPSTAPKASSNIPGIGSVPDTTTKETKPGKTSAPTKAEQPTDDKKAVKKTKSGGIGKMFGMGSKK